MYFVFADDAKQERPSRDRMGPLVAAGAILVNGDRIKGLETAIETLCKKTGFPVDDPIRSEFKWSPGRELWIRNNLAVTDREQFFLSVIERLADAEVKVIVAIDDQHCSVANSSEDGSTHLTHEQDATYLLFERINRALRDLEEDAIVINDRPSAPENEFLAAALEMWRRGTRYVRFDRIAINLLCTQSRFVRLLQCADLVTSCVTAYVSGENVWSPRIFSAIKPLLHSKDGRIGGCGIKFHTTRHRNLYHWLLGDSNYHASGTIYPLPFDGSYDHAKPQEMESWRIYLELLKIIKAERPLIVSWLELARPGNYSNGLFELQFPRQYSLACESLSRPNNLRLVSEVLSEITGIKTEPRYSVVKHF
jgi:hypothetical protein